MKKLIFKLAMAMVAFGLFLPFGSANDANLELRIHKNDLTGDIWANENKQIKVIIEKNGEKTGINQEINEISDRTKYSPSAGAIKKVDTTECVFEWFHGDEQIKKIEKITRYEQAPVGEFFVPPTRISEEKLIFAQDDVPNCGGDDKDYEAFSAWLASQVDNPFDTYSETLFVNADDGFKYTVSIAGENNIKLATEDNLQGYTCQDAFCSDDIIINANRRNLIDLVILQDGDLPPLELAGADLEPGNNAEYSSLVTAVGNFTARSSSLLDWSLKIDENGLRNPKIEQIFNKFLNIANGLFIITLLGIALMWNFSVLIPKGVLKKSLAYFIIAMITVNFALPITRLAVDGANLIQNSLFQVTTTEETKQIGAEDILLSPGLEYGSFVGTKKSSYIEQSYPQNLGEEVNKESLSNKDDLYVDRYQEQVIFNIILVALGAIGQLLIALIIVFRYVILWFLLIFSPFLFVLFLVPSLRGIFKYWIWLYSRWILIGPLLAMSLFIIVNIWTHTGVPLESTYQAPSGLIFPDAINLNISAPGLNYGFLNTPRTVMKYITALMMLYMAIILPFWLTRAIFTSINNNQNNNEEKNNLISKIFNRNKETNTNREIYETTSSSGSSVQAGQKKGFVKPKLMPDIKNFFNKSEENEQKSQFMQSELKNQEAIKNVPTEDLMERSQILEIAKDSGKIDTEKEKELNIIQTEIKERSKQEAETKEKNTPETETGLGDFTQANTEIKLEEKKEDQE